MQATHINPLTGENEVEQAAPVSGMTAGRSTPTIPTTWGKVQRNAPCPCGSGRKYKHCHGALSLTPMRLRLIAAFARYVRAKREIVPC